MKPIYLDYNATTPLHPDVVAAMRPYLEGGFGNPSSTHWYGVEARKAVERSRVQVAEALGAKSEDVVFTSGGSESNNTAILGVARRYRNKGNHIITSAVEHPAVMEVCRFLEKDGFTLSVLPVDEYGMVDPEAVERAVRPETILITIMHANNEVGTIMPIEEIAAVAGRHGVLFHTDAAQSIGKISVRVDDLGVDLLSLAAHKLYAPKGVGALYIRPGVGLPRLIHGAEHEMGRRAGTENVAGIVGLGMACELARRDLFANARHCKALRDRLHRAIADGLPEGAVRLNGHPDRRLPNTLNLGFRGVMADTLLSALSDVAASAGAACHVDREESSVLSAMKVPAEFAMGAVRFSTGMFLSEEDIDRAANSVIDAVRPMLPTEGREAPAAAAAGEDFRLTRFSHGLGCGCKLRPQDLNEVLSRLPLMRHEALIVGTETADDAAVYRLRDDLVVVQTVDFFTPIVDDPYQFGAIAAANSISDIYAMNAKPLFALNVVNFPAKRLPLSVLERILRGAQDKAREAGVVIVGGHSIEDAEPKYGMVVTGTAHPDEIVTNVGLEAGDALVLTKPIGTGIITTAMKRGSADPEVAAGAIESMTALNNVAAELMGRFDVHAATDVTGFGLLGHLLEMTQASRVDAVLFAGRVPLLPGTRELAAGFVPGGTRNNLAHTAPQVDWSSEIGERERLVINDAQTSGGLIIALPEGQAGEFVAECKRRGLASAAVIGRGQRIGRGRIRVE